MGTTLRKRCPLCVTNQFTHVALRTRRQWVSRLWWMSDSLQVNYNLQQFLVSKVSLSDCRCPVAKQHIATLFPCTNQNISLKSKDITHSVNLNLILFINPDGYSLCLLVKVLKIIFLLSKSYVWLIYISFYTQCLSTAGAVLVVIEW